MISILLAISTLLTSWQFAFEKTDHQMPAEQDKAWEEVTIPHDWAIYGPFDRANDLQNVTVWQNGETFPSLKTGRSGGLPYMGSAWYKTTIDAPQTPRAALLFDGAMSEAEVYVNGQKAIFWPYGYNAFHVEITPYLHEGANEIAVRLQNREQSSRWYPGAGLFRPVQLICSEDVYVPVWGTHITTPYVTESLASVNIKTRVANATGKQITLRTLLVSKQSGEVADSLVSVYDVKHDLPLEQNFTLPAPLLWSPESPNLYIARTTVLDDGEVKDETETVFGIRSVQIVPNVGFLLNGKVRKFQGVCLHHDLGPLGAAAHREAIRRQLLILKDMGCDAIRTSHNMPAPELVELCDEMGFMMMIEPFDEWDVAKCDNGYHRLFAEWAERDMVNMLRHYRNNASVVMWSVGNEVPTQWTAGGYKVASWLQGICHREDPTRPVTCGMDQIDSVLENGFAALLDVPGFNYKVSRYAEAYAKLPQNLILGSETASTVSSRGVYHFPNEGGAQKIHADNHSSSYDTEHCSWSNIPDLDFAADEDLPYVIGQFVWTGFDYLGEPSPYDTDAWPNHSSMFGIIDLASIPKDRYWLYRSVWNSESPTLHILPHWTWRDRKGEPTPVYVYTSYPSAELFLNGRSLGIRTKHKGGDVKERYRLMWDDVAYEAGELRVVAYDADGKAAAEKSVRTAGRPYRLEAIADRSRIAADGEDLAYIEVRAVDKEGNIVPTDAREVRFKVSGAGSFRAAANGDPKSLEAFHLPHMHLFGGRLTAIVQAGIEDGTLTFEASAKGLKPAVITIKTE